MTQAPPEFADSEEFQEVALIRLPIRVTGLTQLIAGLEKVHGEKLVMPKHHAHGENVLVIARDLKGD